METVVRINTNLSAIPVGTTGVDRYDEEVLKGVMDDETLCSLVRDIEKVDKLAHEAIYRLIRTVKPATFFATNGLGTCFNINNLPDKIKWEIDWICRLSIADQTRKRVIQAAGETHEKTLDELATNLRKRETV